MLPTASKSGDEPLDVAIVDHSLGNLFSVRLACHHVGLTAEVTADPGAIADARSLVIPGVGAFRDAMQTLRERRLIEPIMAFADGGRPLLGVCLGFQLLMSRSEEFGSHQGLGLIPGLVVRFPSGEGPGGKAIRVPQVGWNKVHVSSGDAETGWSGTLLNGIRDGEYMYFVHSYYVRTEDESDALASTHYGGIRYCSAAGRSNVLGVQFHPERSGEVGLTVYRNLARTIRGASDA